MTHTVHQGQKYAHGQHEYLALETGTRCVKVALIDYEQPWPLHAPTLMHASQLTPLPVRRYGEIR
jgi:hypothetical protein